MIVLQFLKPNLIESGKWRNAVDPENLPLKLVQVMKLIKDNPHMSYKQLADKTGKSRETVRLYLKQLRDEFKLIDRMGSKKNGKWFIIEQDKPKQQ